MENLQEHIVRIYSKLQQLSKQYASVKKENELLTIALKKSQKENETNQEKVIELQQQILILKSASEKMNETDKKAFEKNINQYIKEIDKCIALLSE
jgi:uncharacterized protein YlxW (UPF0749 family)